MSVTHGSTLPTVLASRYPMPSLDSLDKDTFVAFTHEDELMEFFVRTEENNVYDYLAFIPIEDDWIEDHVVEGKDLLARSLLNLDNDYPDKLDPRKDN